ncbi:TonB-dependent receptor [Tsuneonella rigui]|uniref:TonB-dependent receptor n=1 Tax=Tsuneonella rigui TaxID=1708790 RepID=UPI000F7E8E46|nr:TonB-dependent receptor [Tsuneonella rigui]
MIGAYGSLVLLGSGAAHAQEAGAVAGEGQAEDEIVVTAQKREENLSDVPISIAVLGGEQLDESVASGLTEALRSVPGVTATVAVQGSGTQLSIRGVTAGAPLFTGSSTVAYYLDSVPFGLSKTAIVPDTNVFDLQRVEVLRGPQGTLYGAGSLNGVVRVLTADPDYASFDLKARVGVSSTDHGGENYRGDVAVNVPLVNDRVALRAVGSYQDFGGWIDRPIGKDANDEITKALRVKLGAQMTDNLEAVASVWLSRSRAGAPPYSPDNRSVNVAINEPVETDFTLYGLKLTYSGSRFDVTSATGFLDFYNNGYVQVGSSVQQTWLKSEVFSQEVNIQSNSAGSWRWGVGAIYRDAYDRLYANIPKLIVAPLETDNKSRSIALFADVTKLLLDQRLELTAGLRYFHDSVHSKEYSNTAGTKPAGLFATPEFQAWTPRVLISFHPTKRMTLYSSYSQGFRSGFNQNPTVIAFGLPPVRPDKLSNYEIGFKADGLGDILSLDAAVYYIDWRDVQQSLTLPLPNGVRISAGVNGQSASGFGYDISATLRPVPGLSIGGGLSVNDLTFDADVISGGIVLFPKGSRLNASAKATSNAFGSYRFGLGDNGMSAEIAASINHSTPLRLATLSGGVPLRTVGDSLTFARASLAVNGADDRWSVMVFADNLTNEDGAFTIDALPPNRTIHARPRTIGVQADFKL